MSNTKAKNTICLWFNKDAQDAARFYAATFPNSDVTGQLKTGHVRALQNRPL